jgi:hypothetical protein
MEKKFLLKKIQLTDEFPIDPDTGDCSLAGSFQKFILNPFPFLSDRVKIEGLKVNVFFDEKLFHFFAESTETLCKDCHVIFRDQLIDDFGRTVFAVC